jgi:hypothetical protein
LGLVSGGQAVPTSIGLPPLWTVGAAESFSPPASGRMALFSIAIDVSAVLPALPVVVFDAVLQLVSGFAPAGALVCDNAGVTANNPARAVAMKRLCILSLCEIQLKQSDPNVRVPRLFLSGRLLARRRMVRHPG